MGKASEESAGILDVFYPKGSTLCTDSFSTFLDEFRTHTDLFLFVVHLVGKADESRILAAKALLPGARDENEKRRFQETMDNPEVVLNELKKHSKVLSQNMTNGIVSSFQNYLSSVIQNVALKRPVILTSTQSVKVDDILRFSRHKDLVSFIVDKKINELSYGGISEIEKYFNDNLGIGMFRDECQRNMLKIFIESRNINVHNGGIVNEIFSKRVGLVEGFTYKIGKVFHLDLDKLVTLSENAIKLALEIDNAVGTKFKLRRRTHMAWQGARKAKGKQ